MQPHGTRIILGWIDAACAGVMAGLCTFSYASDWRCHGRCIGGQGKGLLELWARISFACCIQASVVRESRQGCVAARSLVGLRSPAPTSGPTGVAHLASRLLFLAGIAVQIPVPKSTPGRIRTCATASGEPEDDDVTWLKNDETAGEAGFSWLGVVGRIGLFSVLMLPICCQAAPRSARERLTPQVEGPVILDGIDEALEGALSAFTTDEVGDHTVGPLGGLADADSDVGGDRHTRRRARWRAQQWVGEVRDRHR